MQQFQILFILDLFLHPATIALGLERVRTVWERLDAHLRMPVITVAGTNGKGSTCAMLEAILVQAGYRVGVYTSPHLLHFGERCRLDGAAVTEEALLPHFEAVDSARGDVELTYFEFTTLVILRLLAHAGPDVAILEVGLGGRLDAVNIIDADCAIITSIDLDHMEYLGSDREQIGREKAAIMRPGRPAVVSDPVPPASVVAHATQIGADLWLAGRDFVHGGDRQQWSWRGRERGYSGLAFPALRGVNQLLNAAGVLAAFAALRNQLPVSAQAVRSGLALVELPGRFQVVPGQPTLVLDVAHNPHAVSALAQNLDQMGFFPRTRAVFGAMADKDISAMLQIMTPWVDHWHFCDLDTPRAASAQQLMDTWGSRPESSGALGLPVPTASVHADASAALLAAIEASDPADRILVFGSFLTVGGVLKEGVPRLAAPHAQPAAGSASA